MSNLPDNFPANSEIHSTVEHGVKNELEERCAVDSCDDRIHKLPRMDVDESPLQPPTPPNALVSAKVQEETEATRKERSKDEETNEISSPGNSMNGSNKTNTESLAKSCSVVDATLGEPSDQVQVNKTTDDDKNDEDDDDDNGQHEDNTFGGDENKEESSESIQHCPEDEGLTIRTTTTATGLSLSNRTPTNSSPVVVKQEEESEEEREEQEAHIPNEENSFSKSVTVTNAARKNFAKHNRKSGSELRVKCNFCKNTFKNAARLQTHVTKFHAQIHEPFVPASSELDSSKSDLHQNLETEGYDGKDELKCPVCDKQMDTKSILLLHINSRHVLDRLRICLECAKLFDSQERLDEHIKQEHKDSDLYSRILSKKPKLMPKKALKRNLYNSNNPDISDIDMKDSIDKSFQKVEGNDVNSLLFQCVKCSSTFEGEEEIRKHFENDKDCMLKKATHQRHTCPICKKVLKTNIAEHMRTHSDERPYECTICLTRFKRGHQLKMHVQSLHSDEARFACEICGRRFKRKDKLSCHYRSHTDDHPYMCTECGNVFKWKHHVKRHMMTVHQNIKRKESMKRHPCHICGKSFTWGHHVKRHLRNVHHIDTTFMGRIPLGVDFKGLNMGEDMKTGGNVDHDGEDAGSDVTPDTSIIKSEDEHDEEDEEIEDEDSMSRGDVSLVSQDDRPQKDLTFTANAEFKEKFENLLQLAETVAERSMKEKEMMKRDSMVYNRVSSMDNGTEKSKMNEKGDNKMNFYTEVQHDNVPTRDNAGT